MRRLSPKARVLIIVAASGQFRIIGACMFAVAVGCIGGLLRVAPATERAGDLIVFTAVAALVVVTVAGLVAWRRMADPKPQDPGGAP